MAVGPRVAYRVTTVKLKSNYFGQSAQVLHCTTGPRMPEYTCCSLWHSRGKLYMKQACAATIHSALVSQKMAMLH